MKKRSILIIVSTIILSLGIFLNTNTYAQENTRVSEYKVADNTKFSITEVFDATKKFQETGKNGDSSIDSEEIAVKFSRGIKGLGETLIAIGIAISVGASIILGIQFFMAAGDPGKQAKVKEGLVGFAVAVVLLAAAYQIWSIVVDLVGKLSN